MLEILSQDICCLESFQQAPKAMPNPGPTTPLKSCIAGLGSEESKANSALSDLTLHRALKGTVFDTLLLVHRVNDSQQGVAALT